MLVCTACKISKDESAFSLNKTGYRKKCIQCRTLTNKKCCYCNIDKPINEFYISNDCYKPYCKKCSYLYNKAHSSAETKEKRKEYMRNYMRSIYETAKTLKSLGA
jgi:hypothetical protein